VGSPQLILCLVRRMRRYTLSILLTAALLSATATGSGEPAARLRYNAANILEDPREWVYDLQSHKTMLAKCFRGDTEAFLTLERIAPQGDGEQQASALLWLVIHIWGDQKYADFLGSQPELYRRRVSRTLRWTFDEGGWHHPIPNGQLQPYLATHFPLTWRIAAEYPKPTLDSTPIPLP